MLIIKSEALERMSQLEQRRLKKSVDATMLCGYPVISSSGAAAQLAIDWCITNGYGFNLAVDSASCYRVTRGTK